MDASFYHQDHKRLNSQKISHPRHGDHANKVMCLTPRMAHLTPHANKVSKKHFSGLHMVDAPHGAFDAAELAVVRLVAELEAGEAPGADDAAGPSGHHAPVDQQLGHR